MASLCNIRISDTLKCRNLIGRMQDEAIKAQRVQDEQGAAHAQSIGADRDINADRIKRIENELILNNQLFLLLN